MKISHELYFNPAIEIHVMRSGFRAESNVLVHNASRESERRRAKEWNKASIRDMLYRKIQDKIESTVVANRAKDEQKVEDFLMETLDIIRESVK